MAAALTIIVNDEHVDINHDTYPPSEKVYQGMDPEPLYDLVRIAINDGDIGANHVLIVTHTGKHQSDVDRFIVLYV